MAENTPAQTSLEAVDPDQLTPLERFRYRAKAAAFEIAAAYAERMALLAESVIDAGEMQDVKALINHMRQIILRDSLMPLVTEFGAGVDAIEGDELNQLAPIAAELDESDLTLEEKITIVREAIPPSALPHGQIAGPLAYLIAGSNDPTKVVDDYVAWRSTDSFFYKMQDPEFMQIMLKRPKTQEALKTLCQTHMDHMYFNPSLVRHLPLFLNKEGGRALFVEIVQGIPYAQRMSRMGFAGLVPDDMDYDTVVRPLLDELYPI